jgi:hypothetical protein
LVSDEYLRELERALPTGGAGARLRYADALRRLGRPGQAIQVMEPLLQETGVEAERARVQMAHVYLETGDPVTAFRILSFDFSEEGRREYPAIGQRLEQLLLVPDTQAQASRAIGNLAPTDDLVRVFRSLPRQTQARAARPLLAIAIQRRDRDRAQELAKDEKDASVAGLLRADGELLL